MSIINDEPEIDDVIVIHVGSITEYYATLNIRIRMNNRWLYVNSISMFPNDELTISDNGTSKSDSIIGSSEAILETIPHNFGEELKLRTKHSNV